METFLGKRSEKICLAKNLIREFEFKYDLGNV